MDLTRVDEVIDAICMRVTEQLNNDIPNEHITDMVQALAVLVSARAEAEKLEPYE